MKQSFPSLVLGLGLAVLLAQDAGAQNYSIDWYKIAGGGGTSSGGNYQLSGTIGQADAGSTMSGGNYSLTGGFWSIISAIPTPGLPNLVITWISPNSVRVSWPATGAYTLLSNNNLTGAAWSAFGGTVTTANGTNSVTITPPNGNLFFRLSQ